ncbi:MAG: N-acyl amino acid synthase FeeM domain-containing protein [Bacteroidia bacterium]|jgi:hypothetical protein
MVNYKVASTFQEVTEAWCLVYKQYLAASLIMPNELSVFTFPEYISSNAAVFMGKKMGHMVSTVSAVLDSERGLPLDHYYKNDLDVLRKDGKKLIEIGLLADTRAAGNFQNITELMAGIARFGVYSDHHDFVIGVHPRRMAFFNQVFGFKQVGEIRDYGKLRTAPVVLLHANGLDLQEEKFELNREIYSSPMQFDFENRYLFDAGKFVDPAEMSDSISNFIQKIWGRNIPQAA